MDHRYNKFLVLVETGSFSKAAKKLRISQPAMTISIASLEKSLNKKLLSKKKPNIELTSDGEIVYDTAKKILKEIEQMQKSLNRSADETVHVGFIDSIAHLVYSKSRNNIILKDIEVMVDNSKKIISDLVSNQIDYGFITGQPNQLGNSIIVSKLHDEPFVFVKKSSMVSDEKVIEIDDWLAFNRASTSFHHFTKQFKNYGLSVKPIFFSTSMELLKNMVINGNGTALLPKHFVMNEIKNGQLKIVNTQELFRPIWIVSNKNQKFASKDRLSNFVDGLLAES